MKAAIIFFILGLGQGFILTDWVRSRQVERMRGEDQRQIHTKPIQGSMD